jgi:DNA-binding LytR/AlgR family response regulator
MKKSEEVIITNQVLDNWKNQIKEMVVALLEQYLSDNQKDITPKIKLRTINEIHYIITNTLEAVQVKDYVCYFYIGEKEPFCCTKKLKAMKLLLQSPFEQISKNTIVNTAKIRTINLSKRTITLVSGLHFEYPQERTAQIEALADKNNNIIN